MQRAACGLPGARCKVHNHLLVRVLRRGDSAIGFLFMIAGAPAGSVPDRNPARRPARPHDGGH
jgi:hypothetical protein